MDDLISGSRWNFPRSTHSMIYDNSDVAVVKNTTAARQGVTGHNVRYVLGASMLGVIIAFALIAMFLGGTLPT